MPKTDNTEVEAPKTITDEDNNQVMTTKLTKRNEKHAVNKVIRNSVRLKRERTVIKKISYVWFKLKRAVRQKIKYVWFKPKSGKNHGTKRRRVIICFPQHQLLCFKSHIRHWFRRRHCQHSRNNRRRKFSFTVKADGHVLYICL